MANSRNVLWFAVAGALSGCLSGLLLELPGSRLLESFGGTTFYPGLFFGLGLCALLFTRLNVAPAKLFAVLLIVQAAWQLAVPTATSTMQYFESRRVEVSPGVPIAMPGAAVWQQAQNAKPPIKPELIIPGLIAGLVGSFGTWCAMAFAVAKLRTIEASAWTTVIGGITGTLLATDNFTLLFVVWQTLVAATLAYKIGDT